MGKKITIVIILLLLRIALPVQSQIRYQVESQTIGTSNGTVPFWMRSNQFGSIPKSGLSESLIAQAHKDFEPLNISDSLYGRKKLIDWGFGFNGRGNVAKNSNILLVEAYAKLKVGVFQIRGGRSNDVMGLNGDSLLTSGNFAQSGNALGIPKIELSIPNYYNLPILGRLFSVKGAFSHGWVGRTLILEKVIGEKDKILYNTFDRTPKTYFHQKSLYVKFGKPDWNLKLYGGFSHQVFWGNEQAAYGPLYDLSPVKSFFYVVTGLAYGTQGIPRSKIGNQLGSIDVGAEYNFNNFKVMAYRQTFYDVGALAKLANIRDGLNGISLENTNSENMESKFIWKKILIEHFYSKDQAGYPWSTHTASGDEDYYNNYYYVQGWSYKGEGLGNPLITPLKYAKPGQVSGSSDYFISNRVSAFHVGVLSELYSWHIMTKMSFSRSYGTFGTSKYGKSTGFVRHPNTGPTFIPVNQYSFYVDAMRPLENNYSVGFSTALDMGQLLNNSFGLAIKIRKSFP